MEKEKSFMDKEWCDNDYLFVSQHGNPIKPKQYSNAFKRLLTAHISSMEEYELAHGKLPEGEIKLSYISLYGFRTSFATNNMRRFPKTALISSIMGNSLKTLIQFYTQTDTDMQKELINNYVNLERTYSHSNTLRNFTYVN